MPADLSEVTSSGDVGARPEPYVSVVVPTCGRQERLFDAIASVGSQSFAGGFEIIVVDNGPEGGLRETVLKQAPTLWECFRLVRD